MVNMRISRKISRNLKARKGIRKEIGGDLN
jgi:hypothetical protein